MYRQPSRKRSLSHGLPYHIGDSGPGAIRADLPLSRISHFRVFAISIVGSSPAEQIPANRQLSRQRNRRVTGGQQASNRRPSHEQQAMQKTGFKASIRLSAPSSPKEGTDLRVNLTPRGAMGLLTGNEGQQK